MTFCADPHTSRRDNNHPWRDATWKQAASIELIGANVNEANRISFESPIVNPIEQSARER